MKNQSGNAEDARTERFVANMNQHQARLTHYLASVAPGCQAIQDLLQDTNLVLWRKRTEFKEGANFWAWACGIAYHEVLHFRRKQQRSKLVYSDALVEQMSDDAQRCLEDQSGRVEALNTCLEKLPHHYRQVVEDRYLKSIAVQDIATQGGTTANAVSKVLQRSRLALLKCIEESLAEEEGG